MIMIMKNVNLNLNLNENKNQNENESTIKIDKFKYLINNDLQPIDILDISDNTNNIDNTNNNDNINNNIINLKTHEEIYLEIYKNAKEKSKRN